MLEGSRPPNNRHSFAFGERAESKMVRLRCGTDRLRLPNVGSVLTEGDRTRAEVQPYRYRIAGVVRRAEFDHAFAPAVAVSACVEHVSGVPRVGAGGFLLMLEKKENAVS